MIGHFLLTLTTKQEDAVLGTPLSPGLYFDYFDKSRCLVGAALGGESWFDVTLILKLHESYPRDGAGMVSCSPEIRFDGLCKRFGVQRIAAAIRNRILSNRARRTLQTRVEEAVA